MEAIRNKKGFICDMDGVIYHGSVILDGVADFVNWMQNNGKQFVFLTNSPERTPHELSMKLERMGLSVSPDHFYTSAMATAEFCPPKCRDAPRTLSVRRRFPRLFTTERYI